MNNDQFIESLSLLLTPVVYFSLFIVIHDYAPALLRNRGSFHWWLLLGIVISMSFKLPDNFFWNIPWSAKYFESSSVSYWFNWGPYSNVPFRQIAIILACLCHRIASAKSGKKISFKAVAICVILSVLLWLFAIWIATNKSFPDPVTFPSKLLLG